MTATVDDAAPDTGTTVVRAACPHDCPDTCAMLVTVDDDGTATERRAATPTTRTPAAACA